VDGEDEESTSDEEIDHHLSSAMLETLSCGVLGGQLRMQFQAVNSHHVPTL
jgi:hypothetical protein